MAWSMVGFEVSFESSFSWPSTCGAAFSGDVPVVGRVASVLCATIKPGVNLAIFEAFGDVAMSEASVLDGMAWKDAFAEMVNSSGGVAS